jgi:hypothetical protein
LETVITGEILVDDDAPADKALSAALAIPYSGDWDIAVTQITGVARHFLNSPLRVPVSAAETDPEHCEVDVISGGVIDAGSPFVASVLSFDRFSNPTNHPEDAFEAFLGSLDSDEQVQVSPSTSLFLILLSSANPPPTPPLPPRSLTATRFPRSSRRRANTSST